MRSPQSQARIGLDFIDDGQTVKKLLNPFEWTQHTLDNFTSRRWLGLAGVVPGWCRGGAEVVPR